MSYTKIIVLVVLYIICTAEAGPERFANFLLNNKWDSGLPLSYKVPTDYWKNVPPVNQNNQSMFVAACGRVCTIDELNKYTAQTEQLLTVGGINLYDAAVREISLALLGHSAVAEKYELDTLIGSKTLQFGSIRGDAPCKGITVFNDCSDTTQTGSCGFCYGGNTGTRKGVSVDTSHAFFFRLISDVYAYGGTVDQRCPEKNLQWTWNDWRPVAGENAWANFLGPLQVAYLKAGKNVNAIEDASTALLLATRMFSTFQTAQMPNGAIAYAPYNTYDYENPALGGTGSVENAASALAGLRALLYIVGNKQTSQYKSIIPQLKTVIDNLTNFIKSAYNPATGYFRQGGTYHNGVWAWNADPASVFAVDCQTWVITVLGATTIDSWFGAGTTLNIWSTTKKIGGFNYQSSDSSVLGLGFSTNSQVQVLSGEWSLGGVNMLRVIAKQLPTHSAALLYEADTIRQAVDDYLTTHDNSINSYVVSYSNKRYYIPFGWWANPIPSTASVGWSVMVDSNFNPFVLGGDY